MLKVGEKYPNLVLQDLLGNWVKIPDLGEIVVGIVYNTIEVSDVGNNFQYIAKTRLFSQEYHRGLGIVNLQDSEGTPTFLKAAIDFGAEANNLSLIMTDPDGIVKESWGLTTEEARGQYVYMLFDHTGTLRFVRPTNRETMWAEEEIAAWYSLISELVEDCKTAKGGAGLKPASYRPEDEYRKDTLDRPSRTVFENGPARSAARVDGVTQKSKTATDA